MHAAVLRTFGFIAWLLPILVSLGTARQALAQDSLRTFAVPDTVVVVGERLSADALSVPMATTNVGPDDWQTGRSIGLDEPLGTIPGVIAQSRAGSNDVRITTRGFGARGAGERSNAGTTRGIRITLDGFPLTEPDGRTSLDFADAGLLERIRVVRSNTSTLYGPASGGLIDLQTTHSFPKTYGQLRAEFGSFGYARQVAEAGMLAGKARIRVAGSTGSCDGFRDHSRGTQTTLFASVVTDPAPATTVVVFAAGTHNLQHQPGALTQAEFDADPTQADPTYVAEDARRDNHIGRMGVKLDRGFGGGETLKLGVFVEPKSLHRSERNRYRDFQRVHTGGFALLTGPLADGRVRWTAGVDEAWQDGSVLFYDLVDGQRGTTLVADQREGINSFGAYAEVAVEPAPRWTATAGARWDNVHYVSEDHQAPQLDDQRSLDHISPRLSLAFRHAERHLLYATVNGGIETPAFNEIDPPAPYDTLTTLNPFLEPSHSLTFEIGAKGEWRFGNGSGGGAPGSGGSALGTSGPATSAPGGDALDGDGRSGDALAGRGGHRLAYDIALYTLEVRNDIIPFDGGAFYQTAGLSRRSGIEIGVTGALSNGLSLRLAGNFTRNRYVDYVTGTTDSGGNLVTVSYDDNESAGIPSTVLQGVLRYQHPRGLYGEVGLQHLGAYWANDANTDRVEAYTLLDLTVGSTLDLEWLDANIFVSGRNLTDEDFAASAYINGANGRYLEPGMERNVLMGVTLGVD